MKRWLFVVTWNGILWSPLFLLKKYYNLHKWESFQCILSDSDFSGRRINYTIFAKLWTLLYLPHCAIICCPVRRAAAWRSCPPHRVCTLLSAAVRCTSTTAQHNNCSCTLYINATMYVAVCSCIVHQQLHCTAATLMYIHTTQPASRWAIPQTWIISSSFYPTSARSKKTLQFLTKTNVNFRFCFSVEENVSSFTQSHYTEQCSKVDLYATFRQFLYLKDFAEKKTWQLRCVRGIWAYQRDS